MYVLRTFWEEIFTWWGKFPVVTMAVEETAYRASDLTQEGHEESIRELHMVWCWTMSWGKWWEIRHLRFSKDCDLFVFVFFGFFWLLSLGLSAWVRWVLLPRICKHLELLLLDKLWVVLNDGHHKYAGLIEFDLIMVVWFMMMMMMIYEIEGVTELGASSAWDLSEICFNSLLHRILFGNWISIGYYVWWQRDEGVNMENLPWASGKDLCTV